MVICLEQGADLHMAQLMPLPLPLTVSCSSKIQIGFTFLVPAHLGSPRQRAVKRVCVCAQCDNMLLHCGAHTLLHKVFSELYMCHFIFFHWFTTLNIHNLFARSLVVQNFSHKSFPLSTLLPLGLTSLSLDSYHYIWTYRFLALFVFCSLFHTFFTFLFIFGSVQ